MGCTAPHGKLEFSIEPVAWRSTFLVQPMAFAKTRTNVLPTGTHVKKIFEGRLYLGTKSPVSPVVVFFTLIICVRIICFIVGIRMISVI